MISPHLWPVQEAVPGLQPAPRERHSLAIVQHYLVCAGGMQLQADGEAHALVDTWVRPHAVPSIFRGEALPGPALIEKLEGQGLLEAQSAHHHKCANCDGQGRMLTRSAVRAAS